MQNQATSGGLPRRELSLFDTTCLVAGIIIGAGIYQTAPDVAKGAGSAGGVLVLWLLGGLLSLCGALGYAELATAYPQTGGDFVYLSRAYGRWAGFLFGWIQTVIVRPGDIALMAFAFATYGCALYDPVGEDAFLSCRQIYAGGIVIVLTAINVAGVKAGKWTQNLLTTIKVLGLMAIIALAVIAPRSAGAPAAFGAFPISVALILVLFTFGGWNEVAYVAAEVKDPRRNILRTLVVGIGLVTGLYLAANGAFLRTLGHAGLAGSAAVAAEAVAPILPGYADRLVSALICLSAAGAVNGLVFAGARISYAVGAEHRLFRPLGRWEPRTGTPLRSLMLQAGIAVGLILVLGTFLDTILYTAAAVYTFYLATSLAVIVLRKKEPMVERPYRVTGYPFTILLFSAACLFLIYSAVVFKPVIAGLSCVLLLAGLPVYWLTSRSSGDTASIGK